MSQKPFERGAGKEKGGGGNGSEEKVNQGPSNLHNLLNCFSVVIQLSIVFQF